MGKQPNFIAMILIYSHIPAVHSLNSFFRTEAHCWLFRSQLLVENTEGSVGSRSQSSPLVGKLDNCWCKDAGKHWVRETQGKERGVLFQVAESCSYLLAQWNIDCHFKHCPGQAKKVSFPQGTPEAPERGSGTVAEAQRPQEDVTSLLLIFQCNVPSWLPDLLGGSEAQLPHASQISLFLHLSHNWQMISGFVTDCYYSLITYSFCFHSCPFSSQEREWPFQKQVRFGHVLKTRLLHIPLR